MFTLAVISLLEVSTVSHCLFLQICMFCISFGTVVKHLKLVHICIMLIYEMLSHVMWCHVMQSINLEQRKGAHLFLALFITCITIKCVCYDIILGLYFYTSLERILIVLLPRTIVTSRGDKYVNKRLTVQYMNVSVFTLFVWVSNFSKTLGKYIIYWDKCTHNFLNLLYEHIRVLIV